MAYIHEWPEFTWDTHALAQALSAVRHKQGKHLGKMEALGFELRTEASVTASPRQLSNRPPSRASIEAKRKAYYIQLESTQRGSLDITSWMAWFLGCLNRAIDASDTMLASVLHKARLWQRINTKPVSERQRTVINRMLEHDWVAHLNTSQYAGLAKCSQDTALRDIKALLERDVLIKNARGGRSTSYRLADPGSV
jgi:Fic family protein